MKKWRNKILSAVLTLSLLLTSTSFAFAVGEDEGTTEENIVQIPRTQLSIESFSSQQYQPDNRPTGNGNYDEGPATNAIDGDLGTFWHTIWGGTDSTTGVGAKEDTGKFIVVDLGNPVYLKEIKQYPRTGTLNNMSADNRISNYKVWYSTDVNFTEDKTVTGTFTNSESTDVLKVQTVTFENAVYARYIKFQCTDTGDQHKDKSIAELEFFMDASKMPEITKQPENTFSNGEVTLSVNAEPNIVGDSLSYQWYRYTADSSPVAVDNGNGSTLSVTPTDELTYYFVTITETIDGNAVSINSDVVYVKTASTDFQITEDLGLTVTASSSYSGNDVSYVIDGDKTANNGSGHFWETNYNSSGSLDNNKWIQFDLGNSYYLSKLVYYPRKHNSMNGSITEYKIYVSQDGENWSLVAENPENRWTWQGATGNQKNEIVLGTPVPAKYVKIIPVHTQGDTSDLTASAAEIELFADTTVNDIITAQPVGGIYSDIPLTVEAKADSTYQWYSNSENSYVGAEELTSANTNSYDPKNGLNKYYFVKVTNNDKSVYSNIVYVTTREAKIERADGDYFGSFSEAMDEVRNGETIVLLSDVVLASGYDITTGKSITIKSDDNQNYTIKRGSGLSGFLFKVNNSSSSLTFENIILDGGKNDGITQGGTIINVTNGTLTLNEGVVLQNNKSTGSGGALYITGGTTNINGAEMKDNEALNGAVFYITSGIVNFNGGTITGNTATTNGGVAYVDNNGTLNLNDGTITGNTATNGGALYLLNGTANLGKSGIDNAVTISGNTATKGSGVYLKNTFVNINAVLDLDDIIYIEGNGGRSIAINTDLTGSKPITIDNDDARGATQIFNVKPVAEENRAAYMNAALNVVRVIKGGQQKGTAFTGSNNVAEVNNDYKGEGIALHYTPRSINSSAKSDPTFSVIDVEKAIYVKNVSSSQNIFNASISNSEELYYKWFVLNEETGMYDLCEDVSSLDGTYKAYCVITTQDGALTNTTNDSGFYYVTNIIELTVEDFVPCSQAIAKFKST